MCAHENSRKNYQIEMCFGTFYRNTKKGEIRQTAISNHIKGLPPLATVKKSIFLKYKYLRICPENFKSIRTKLTEM